MSFRLVATTVIAAWVAGLWGCSADTSSSAGAPHQGWAGGNTGAEAGSAGVSPQEGGEPDSSAGGYSGSDPIGGSGGGPTGSGGAAPDGGGGADAAPASPPEPACTSDADCGESRGCLKGLCRDKCIPYLAPCNWKPSGNACTLSGHCVECQTDSDCPGTRYTCDTNTLTCVDKPFDPSTTKIGIFYHTWHCPAAQDVHDLTKILAGSAPYGDYDDFHWWGQPADGFYCPTNNAPLLAKHATLLRDMGVDFVFVDVTNHAWNSNSLCDRPVQMIIEPFTTLVDVWSGIKGAPRIVPWVPVVKTDASHPNATHMVYTLLNLLKAHPGLQFVYQGKPLILVTENSLYPADESKLAALSASYTIRKMWAYEASGTSKWSYMEKCASSPLGAKPCFQRRAMSGGKAEQLPISMAYQADYMSHPATATPKYQGKTLRKQFETLFDNPEVPIATITGWNEWIVQRLKCDQSPLCVCSNPQDAKGCFLDQYDVEYSRDIEPGKNAMGSYYYDLVKSCISLFRGGKRCTPDKANELCCKDWQG